MESLAAFSAAVINGLRARASALAVGLSLATVSLATGFISYTHISALTQDYWQNWKTAHLMPLAVDGQIVIGSVYFMEHSGEHKRWLGLIGVVPGILESLYSNWESVSPPHGTPWLAVIEAHMWATVPAQAFACSTILFERWLHSRRAARPAALPAAVTIPEAAPSVPEPAAPAAPAGAGLVGTPVPVMGPVSPLPAWIKAEQAAGGRAPRAVPDAGDARLPWPGDEGEQRRLVGSMSRNEMWRTYQVSKGEADKIRARYLNKEVKSDAAAA